MTEAEFREILEEALGDYEPYKDEEGIAYTETFANAGVLTSNEGLVVHLAGGTEFQVTIVRSR